MARWSTTYSGAGAITALLFGMFHHFPIGVLLLGTTGVVLLPICNNKHVVHSFSTGLPSYPRAMHRQQSEISSRSSHSKTDAWKSRLDARSDTTTDKDDNDRSIEKKKNIQSGQHKHENVTPSTSNRRRFVGSSLAAATSSSAAATTLLWASNPGVASAKNPKSRTDGYAVQHTDREWAYLLSGAQYNILRKGGTERQKASILHTFTATDHVGKYACAGCGTALFASDSKFSSGTGWPSFAKALDAVEEEAMNPISATLGGKEVRCGTCGGHLGDLFNDGWVYVGTQAFETGNRYCIDGTALVFKPASGGDGEDIYGDIPPPNKVINYESSMFRDNSINSQ
jgi:peptide-methionine (R)-S-oxide reductase